MVHLFQQSAAAERRSGFRRALGRGVSVLQQCHTKSKENAISRTVLGILSTASPALTALALACHNIPPCLPAPRSLPSQRGPCRALPLGRGTRAFPGGSARLSQPAHAATTAQHKMSLLCCFCPSCPSPPPSAGKRVPFPTRAQPRVLQAIPGEHPTPLVTFMDGLSTAPSRATRSTVPKA